MAFIQIETKKKEKITTISALTKKTEVVKEKFFSWERKTCQIEVIATYQDVEENGIKKIEVIRND